jgi:hypothetical protein
MGPSSQVGGRQGHRYYLTTSNDASHGNLYSAEQCQQRVTRDFARMRDTWITLANRYKFFSMSDVAKQELRDLK